MILEPWQKYWLMVVVVMGVIALIDLAIRLFM